MNLHEYQSKQLMASYGLPILPGHLCYTPGEVEAAADLLGGGICVVKAQVHAGGRGKAGGVKLAKNPTEARAHGEKIIGMTLVTPQTGAAGKLVRKVYVEGGCNIAKEFYLSLVVDRASRSISIIASTEGGMEIEEVAHKTPDKIITIAIDPKVGIQHFQTLQLGLRLGLHAQVAKELGSIVEGLYQLFVDKDLAMLEINPLVLTPAGEIIAVEATISWEEMVAAFSEHGHSRMPVYRETLDQVIGMIHIKDVFPFLANGTPPPADWTTLMRQPLYVPQARGALDVLADMRAQKTHLAIVLDEFSGTDGLITIEDLVEEIVGEIEDEHDEDPVDLVVPVSERIWDADAVAELDDVAEIVGDPRIAEVEEAVDTLGGLAFVLAGQVPQPGAVLEHKSGWCIEVLDGDLGVSLTGGTLLRLGLISSISRYLIISAGVPRMSRSVLDNSNARSRQSMIWL